MTYETIVIPDIHNKTHKADAIIERYADVDHLRVIYLGDYFDDWGDGPVQATNTARWLDVCVNRATTNRNMGFEAFKARYPDDQYLDETFLIGNHDMPYLYFDLRWPDDAKPYLKGISAFEEVVCSGWTEAKHHVVQQVLGYKAGCQVLREQMHLYAVVGSWLITHAGVTNYWLTDEEDPMGAAVSNLLSAKRRMDAGYLDALIRAGMDRGGPQLVGGCTWVDWTAFKPTPGINQLVGHTQAKKVRQKVYDLQPADSSSYPGYSSKNICLDTRMAHYARYLTDTDDWEIIEYDETNQL